MQVYQDRKARRYVYIHDFLDLYDWRIAYVNQIVTYVVFTPPCP